MPAIEGSYQHVKSENLDKYFEKMSKIYFIPIIMIKSSKFLHCLL